MSSGIFIIAHAPLASALRQCVGHVFEDRLASVLALDVPAEQAREETLAQARALLAPWQQRPTLLVTDILGATPCNVAQLLLQEGARRLVTGANLPMLLRAVTYQEEALDAVVQRALSGAVQGVQEVQADKT